MVKGREANTYNYTSLFMTTFWAVITGCIQAERGKGKKGGEEAADEKEWSLCPRPASDFSVSFHSSSERGERREKTRSRGNEERGESKREAVRGSERRVLKAGRQPFIHQFPSNLFRPLPRPPLLHRTDSNGGHCSQAGDAGTKKMQRRSIPRSPIGRSLTPADCPIVSSQPSTDPSCLSLSLQRHRVLAQTLVQRKT